MNEIQRKQKIDEIMKNVKGLPIYPDTGIPVRLWIKAVEDPFDEEWIHYCRMMVEQYESDTKKKDNNSCFAEALRNYKQQKSKHKQNE